MKLEYLYTDDSYKEKIADLSSNSITLSEKKKDNLFIFEFSIEGKSNDKAKELSKIHTSVLKKLEESKLFVLLDDAAEHFDEQLYPLINKFERLFRKVIAIIANQKLNEQAIQQARELELLDFGQIYTIFFTDSNFHAQAKILLNKTPLSKNDLIKKLKDEKETTLWKELFGNKYSEIPSSFIKIKDARNDVMHAHNISYNQFSETRDTIMNANSILQGIIEDILTDKAQIKTEGLNSLSKTIESISKLFINNSALGIYQQQMDSMRNAVATLTAIPNLSASLQTPKFDYSAINTLKTQIPQKEYFTPNTLNIQLPPKDYSTINTLNIQFPNETYHLPGEINVHIPKEDDAQKSIENLTVNLPEKEKKHD